MLEEMNTENITRKISKFEFKVLSVNESQQSKANIKYDTLQKSSDSFTAEFFKFLFLDICHLILMASAIAREFKKCFTMIT